jgi:diacylglycerol kinase
MVNMVRFDSLLRSFQYALRGLLRVAKEEQNFRLELLAAAALAVLMVAFDLKPSERAILTLAAVSVLVLELLNSVFERMVDLLKPRIHHYVEDVKDILAGTVLIAALGALAIGLMIFGPHFAGLFR